MLDRGPLRVAVLSQYSLVRVGLTALVGAKPDRAIVANLAEQDDHLSHVDVVVYDLDGLSLDGSPTSNLAHLLAEGLLVVGLAREGRDDLHDRAMAAGVHAVVPESVTSAALLDALEQVVGRGEEARRDAAAHVAGVLTTRERDVLRLIAQGRSNEEVAVQLFVSVNTVKTYIRTAYRKIGVKRRPEAVLWALRYHLVEREHERA